MREFCDRLEPRRLMSVTVNEHQPYVINIVPPGQEVPVEATGTNHYVLRWDYESEDVYHLGTHENNNLSGTTPDGEWIRVISVTNSQNNSQAGSATTGGGGGVMVLITEGSEENLILFAKNHLVFGPDGELVVGQEHFMFKEVG